MKLRYAFFLLIFGFLVTDLRAQNKLLIPYKKANQWGFSDTTGIIKIAPIYDKVDFFDYGRALVYKGALTGLIDEEGTPQIDILYESIERLSPVMYKVRDKGKFGLTTNNGGQVVMTIFDKIQKLSDDFYLVTRDGIAGVLRVTTAEAETIVPLSFRKIDHDPYRRRFVCVDEMGDMSAYDETGKRIATLSLSDMEDDTTVEEIRVPEDIPQRYTLFRENGKKGLIITEPSRLPKNYGKIVTDTLDVRYDSIFPTGKWNFILVLKKKKWGAINEKGEVILEPLYEQVDTKLTRINPDKPERQLFFVKKKGKWGMVRNEAVVIPFIYDSIRDHGRDYLIVNKNGLYGVVSNVTFKELTAVKYTQIVNQWIYTLNDFDVFKVKDGPFENVFVGRNGVEFYSK